MTDVVRLLERHAERCVILARTCQNKRAERFLRMLAVDLMLEAEAEQRAELAAQFAALRAPLETVLA
jgi:hypothetical protein